MRGDEYRPGDALRAAGGVERLIAEGERMDRDAKRRERESAAVNSAGDPVPVFQSFSEIKTRRVDWLIDDWLPQGFLTLLAGAPGMGKTTLALRIAALMTNEGKWSDGSAVTDGSVLLYAGEDSQGATIKPNLIANGADCERVYRVKSMSENGEFVPFEPALHLADIETHLRDDTRLIVIDPALSLTAGSKDEYKPSEIRRILMPVTDMARRRKVAILAVTHFLKRHNSSGSGVLDRIIGSQAWGAVARMVWAVDDTEAGPTLMRVKSNIGPSEGGFRYELVSKLRDDGGKGMKFELGAPVSGRADQVFSAAVGPMHDTPVLDDVTDWLREYFRDTQAEAETWGTILEAGRAAGDYKKSTMRDARDRLKHLGVIECRRSGFGSDGRFLWGICE